MIIVSFWQSIGRDPEDDPSIEVCSDELIAVPDMSLTVQQILERFRKGTVDPQSLVRSVIDTEDDIDDDTFDDLDDLTDVQRLKEESYEKVRRSLQRDRDGDRSAGSGVPEPEDKSVIEDPDSTQQ